MGSHVWGGCPSRRTSCTETRELNRDHNLPPHLAGRGTTASAIGPIVVESSPGWLSEPRVGKNLFAAGPIRPIVDQLDDENYRMGQILPRPLGGASDAWFLWQRGVVILAGSKIPKEVWDDCRSTSDRTARTLTYQALSVLLLELALEKESDQHLGTYRLGGQSGGHGRG